MPVQITGNGLNQIISEIQRKMDSPDLIVELGTALATYWVNAFSASGLNPESGATIRALSKVGEPQRTATGWSIGVGDGSAAGTESTPAPRDTLRKFFDYLEGAGRVWKYTDWWGMSNANKRLLAQARRAGLFGGRGVDYANYLWVQNRGSGRARIMGHGFIESGISSWRGEVPDIIERHFSR